MTNEAGKKKSKACLQEDISSVGRLLKNMIPEELGEGESARSRFFFNLLNLTESKQVMTQK